MSVGSIISRFQNDQRKKAEEERLLREEDIFYAAETDYYLFYRYNNVIKKHIIFDFSNIDIAGGYRVFGQGVIKDKIDPNLQWIYRDDYNNEISEYRFFIERQNGRASYSDILRKDIIGICHVNETAGFNQNNAKIFLYD